MIPSEFSILDGIGLTLPRRSGDDDESHSDGDDDDNDGDGSQMTLLHLLIVSYCICNRKKLKMIGRTSMDMCLFLRLWLFPKFPLIKGLKFLLHAQRIA
jgi:hypothetical protein